jgi:ribosomal protein S17
MSETETAERGVRKERKGVVVSDKAAKTIVVRVTRRIRHPLYGKEMTVSKKFHAHDEKREAKVGDVGPHRGVASHQQAQALAPGGSGDEGRRSGVRMDP